MSNNLQLEYLKELKSRYKNFEYYIFPWKDRFSEQRNNYLSQLREMNYNGWVLTSDTDEHFPEETLKQLRTLIKESKNGEEYTGIKFQVEDVSIDDDDRNKIISRHINEYWKPLMFKFSPEIHYEGEPHESLVGSNLKWKTTELIYQHIRSSLHILSRAAENFYISNSNRYSDKWAEFRYLCTSNNIKTFKDYWTLFEKHELPKEVENWIHQHKDDREDDGDSEVRETYILYEEVLPKRKQKKSTFKERFEQALDSKLTNEITEKIKDSVLSDEMSKSKQEQEDLGLRDIMGSLPKGTKDKIITALKEPKYNYQTSSTKSPNITFPEVKYQISDNKQKTITPERLVSENQLLRTELNRALRKISHHSEIIIESSLELSYEMHIKNVNIDEVIEFIKLTHKLIGSLNPYIKRNTK